MNTTPESGLLGHLEENLFVPQTPELAIAVIKNLTPEDGYRCLLELVDMLVDETNTLCASFIDGETGRDPIKEDTPFRQVAIAAADLTTLQTTRQMLKGVRVWDSESNYHS